MTNYGYAVYQFESDAIAFCGVWECMGRAQDYIEHQELAGYSGFWIEEYEYNEA